MKTRSIKEKEIINEWYIVDLAGVRLGRAAQAISKVLIGKSKVYKTDNLPSGDNVIAINSDKVDFFPERASRKKYYSHSGYPGGFKERTLGDLMEQDSTEVIRKAVWGMLPKTKIGRKLLKNLRIYKEGEYIEKAQNPKTIEIK
ncbi:MAG TPA: 50S ribosomal protein L13 [Candidatus Dojkabacteria bacterium]|jgi:large subunit ribosomal protein L13